MAAAQEMLTQCRRSCREHYKDQPYPTVVKLYGGLEDHVVDEFGFRTPICSENQGLTAISRHTMMGLIALNKKQPAWVPKFTARGFEKVPVPAEIFSKLLTEYDRLKSTPFGEPCVLGTINCERIVSDDEQEESQLNEIQRTYMMHLSQETMKMVEQGLQPLAESWAGVRLKHTYSYGVRRYTNGSWLASHVDRFNTHVISAIINLDQSVTEPWPLYIKDNEGLAHGVVLAPGEMLLYESARAVHGRPRPFIGEFYDNLFIHFSPAGGWYSQAFTLGRKPREQPFSIEELRV